VDSTLPSAALHEDADQGLTALLLGDGRPLLALFALFAVGLGLAGRI
jgi:hypothetical protein